MPHYSSWASKNHAKGNQTTTIVPAVSNTATSLSTSHDNMVQPPAALDANSIAQHHTSLCATAIIAPNSSNQLNNQERMNLYDKGLTAAASIQRQSVKDSTRKAKTAAVRELADWLHSVHAAGSRTLLTVTPEDMLVYFTQHLAPKPCRISHSRRQPHCSPQQPLRAEVSSSHRVRDSRTCWQLGSCHHDRQLYA